METLLWVYPDVGTARLHARERTRYWEPYTRAAADEGFHLLKASPQEVVMSWRDHRCVASVIRQGRSIPLDPRSTVVLGDVYTEPARIHTLWPALSTLVSLRAAGYFLATSLQWMLLGADKFATILGLVDLGIEMLPALRLVPGEIDDELEGRALELGLPLLMKPASWSGGVGLNIAESPATLRRLLRLAYGLGQPFLLQPYLPNLLVDGRAYCIDGEVRLFVERRARRSGDPSNVSLGGQTVAAAAPETVVAAAHAVHALTELPYVCLDVLHDGRQWWLSEVEVDGAISATDGVTAEVAHRLVRERFRAYRRALDRFLLDPTPRPVLPM
jgi:glutathione synthase/RimK-type ligase-like ATP-grasp enzyme